MLQVLGSLFIIMGTLGLGIRYLDKERQRVHFLEKWEYITELFISEVTYHKQPLSLASIEIGKKIGGTEGERLKIIGERIRDGDQHSFSEIWNKEWSGALKKIPLKREEKIMVLEFSVFIGFENQEMQEKMLISQREKWKKVRERAQEEGQEKRKIVMLLSFSIGILIVLILL